MSVKESDHAFYSDILISTSLTSTVYIKCQFHIVQIYSIKMNIQLYNITARRVFERKQQQHCLVKGFGFEITVQAFHQVLELSESTPSQTEASSLLPRSVWLGRPAQLAHPQGHKTRGPCVPSSCTTGRAAKRQ